MSKSKTSAASSSLWYSLSFPQVATGPACERNRVDAEPFHEWLVPRFGQDSGEVPERRTIPDVDLGAAV